MPQLLDPIVPAARDYISYSAIRTYQGCSLRYYFRYIAGLPEPTISASLLIGSAIHAAIEAHYRQLLAGNPPLDLDGLLGVFWDTWSLHGDKAVQYPRGDDQSSVASLAERMLKAFRSSELSTPHGTIIGVEEELRGPVVAGLPDLLARLDLIVDTGDAMTVTDLKTSRTHWDLDHVAGSADQLLLYSELVTPLADGRPVQLEFAVLTKTKSPSVVRHPVVNNLRQVDRTKRIVEKVWRAIEAKHFFPNPSPLQCPTCPFRKPCAEWKG